jgi:phosphohistidine phosphatase SixA
MVVGHNPTLSQFLGRMVGGVQIELRKAGLARVELGRGGASLEWVLTPKLARLLASMA